MTRADLDSKVRCLLKQLAVMLALGVGVVAIQPATAAAQSPWTCATTASPSTLCVHFDVRDYYGPRTQGSLTVEVAGCSSCQVTVQHERNGAVIGSYGPAAGRLGIQTVPQQGDLFRIAIDGSERTVVPYDGPSIDGSCVPEGTNALAGSYTQHSGDSFQAFAFSSTGLPSLPNFASVAAANGRYTATFPGELRGVQVVVQQTSSGPAGSAALQVNSTRGTAVICGSDPDTSKRCTISSLKGQSNFYPSLGASIRGFVRRWRTGARLLFNPVLACASGKVTGRVVRIGRGRPVLIGKGTRTTPVGRGQGFTSVKVRPTRRGRNLRARGRAFRARMTIRVFDADGASVTYSRTRTLDSGRGVTRPRR